MLDIKFVRKNPDAVAKSLADRKAAISMDRFHELDAPRREAIAEVEQLKARRNTVSADIATKKKAGEDASDLIAEMSSVAERVKSLDEVVREADEAMTDFLAAVPNIPHESVPVGDSEDDNRVERTVGQAPTFDFAPKEHWELGTDADLLDFERAAKVAGSRFAVLKRGLARMERALVSFMLDIHTEEHGYTEVLPPYIVNSSALRGTGQLPKFADDLFKLEGTDYWLIPTAEVPVTNLYADETLPGESLPIAHCAFTPCFRSEAGSYGRDTKGLIRQHQFHKVELVRFEEPEKSYAALEELLGHAETILKRLDLHYRVVTLCTGDIGFSAAKTYDIEVWLPGQNAYREISSCSNFEDFQARRAHIRCKNKGEKKARLVHTLNGSGLAIGRTLVAICENYQNQDGTISVPTALQPYMGGATQIG